MIEYSHSPLRHILKNGYRIASFKQEKEDETPVTNSFNSEWKKFAVFTDAEIESAGSQYFDIVTPEMLNKNSVALDIGCGSGRWTNYASSRAKFIEGIDLIDSIEKAADLNAKKTNVRFTQAGVYNIPFPDNSFDFIFCLGVLHHLEETEEALSASVKKLKPGGHYLLYLYYKLDDAGFLMNILFMVSTLIRVIVSRLPDILKLPICDLIALTVYLPFVKLTKAVHYFSPNRKWYRYVPLNYYGDKSFRIMRNDALDRFGTTVEKRFSRNEIQTMMNRAGLTDIVFSENAPCWHAVGRKK